MRRPRGPALRWSVCLGGALAAHLAGAAALWVNRDAAPQEALPPAAMLIDLPPPPKPAPPPPQAVPTPSPPEPPPPEPQKVEEPPPPDPPPEPPKIEEPPPPVETAVVLPKPPPPKPRLRPPPPPDAVVAREAPLAPPALPRPPAPAPVVAAAPAPSAALPTWESEVLARLERFKRYPRRARLRHQEGVATLRFTVGPRGEVLDYALQRSSGVKALDEETLALIERAKPMPPLPAGIGRDHVELVVPIRYVLR